MTSDAKKYNFDHNLVAMSFFMELTATTRFTELYLAETADPLNGCRRFTVSYRIGQFPPAVISRLCVADDLATKAVSVIHGSWLLEVCEMTKVVFRDICRLDPNVVLIDTPMPAAKNNLREMIHHSSTTKVFADVVTR